MNSTAEKTKKTEDISTPPKFLIGVRISNQAKSQLYDPKELKLRVGMTVMVNSNQGLKMGLVASNKIINFRKDKNESSYKVASNLRHRIEMKQVGVRDEAKVIGGFGICGETLCCSSWLPDFTPVTIKMAKNQGLALNPSKISGVCGRLMCCLQYEHDNYKEMVKGMPRVNSQVQTPDGPGKVLKNEILAQRVMVRLDDESINTYPKEELKVKQ